MVKTRQCKEKEEGEEGKTDTGSDHDMEKEVEKEEGEEGKTDTGSADDMEKEVEKEEGKTDNGKKRKRSSCSCSSSCSSSTDDPQEEEEEQDENKKNGKKPRVQDESDVSSVSSVKEEKESTKNIVCTVCDDENPTAYTVLSCCGSNILCVTCCVGVASSELAKTWSKDAKMQTIVECPLCRAASIHVDGSGCTFSDKPVDQDVCSFCEIKLDTSISSWEQHFHTGSGCTGDVITCPNTLCQVKIPRYPYATFRTRLDVHVSRECKHIFCRNCGALGSREDLSTYHPISTCSGVDADSKLAPRYCLQSLLRLLTASLEHTVDSTRRYSFLNSGLLSEGERNEHFPSVFYNHDVMATLIWRCVYNAELLRSYINHSERHALKPIDVVDVGSIREKTLLAMCDTDRAGRSVTAHVSRAAARVFESEAMMEKQTEVGTLGQDVLNSFDAVIREEQTRALIRGPGPFARRSAGGLPSFATGDLEFLFQGLGMPEAADAPVPAPARASSAPASSPNLSNINAGDLGAFRAFLLRQLGQLTREREADP